MELDIQGHFYPTFRKSVCHVDCNGGQVANSHFVRGRVFHDLCTEVGALDTAKVALVALSVADVLVEHVGHDCLNLTLDDMIPDAKASWPC